MAGGRSGAPRRRLLGFGATLIALLVVWLVWAMSVGVLGYQPPERGRAPDGATPIGWPWRGAVHVHTVVSGDASGTVGEISAAAKQLGLDFVVITDHTRAGRAEEPRRPRWVDGVLIIFGEETSLDEGHLLVLGTPNHRYTMGPTARQAVEDVRRLEGHAFAAHPDALATPWRGRLGALDGLEVINLASALDHLLDGSWPSLVRAVFTYPASAAATLLLALDRIPPTVAEWDERTALAAEPGPRPFSAMAAADAHGPQVLGMPTYEQALGALTMTVWLPESPETLAGREREAASLVNDALARGVSALVVGAAGTAPGFVFTATPDAGGDSVGPGSLLPATGASWRFDTGLGGVGEYRIELLRDGMPIAAIDGDDLTFTTSDPGTYRARVFRTDGPAGAGRDGSLPWIMSNPIYVWPEHLIRRTRRFPAPPLPGPPVALSLLASPGWAAESDALSASAMGPLNGGLRWDFTVPRQEEADVHAALAWRPQGTTDWSNYRGISARLGAEQEWRIAVHLWTRDASGSTTTWEQVLPVRPPESTAGVLWSAFRRLGGNDEGVVPGSLEQDDLANVEGIALLVTPLIMRPGTDTSIDVLEFGLIGEN